MTVQKVSEQDMKLLEFIFTDRFYEQVLNARQNAAKYYRQAYKPAAVQDNSVPENNSEYMKILRDLQTLLYSYKKTALV